jgi:hypothetical protein
MTASRLAWIVGLLAVAYPAPILAVVGWLTAHLTLTCTAAAVALVIGPWARRRLVRAL